MFNFLNDKGITLVESMIAVFLTAIAILALMPMQDTAIRGAARSDFLGRASGILQSELEFREQRIMRSAPAVVPVVENQQVTVSGLGSVPGDATFDVRTTTTVNPNANNSWIVNVRVTWTGNATGITSSIIATQQTGFQ